MHNAISQKYKLFSCVFSGFFLLFANGCTSAIQQAKDSGVAEVRKLFETPPVEYSSSPLWVWNDMLTDEQITCNGKRIAAGKRYHTLDYGLFEPFVLKQISRE